MAENVRETGPPEPPPKAPEVRKPTAQSSRAEVGERQEQPPDAQETAHREARDAAQSEHAKATGGREPDGSPPTPELPARMDQHTPAKTPPAGEMNGDRTGDGTPEGRLQREAHDAGVSGRPQPAETGVVSGAGGEWETIDEQPGGAVGQIHPLSCTSACGEMLSGRPQAELVEKLGLPAMQGYLAKELGPDWRPGRRPWGAGGGQLSLRERTLGGGPLERRRGYPPHRRRRRNR